MHQPATERRDTVGHKHVDSVELERERIDAL